MDNKIAAVKMRNITKTFGPVVANDKVWLDIYRGEILALLGENGSGKTTLMNMLSGIYFPDEGQIFIDGKEVVIRSPKDAFDLGIGMIHQHFKLVDVLTAAENIVLGLKEPGRLDRNRVAARVNEICSAYGFEVDPKQKIYDMSVSQKQTVEIVKALYRGADILIRPQFSPRRRRTSFSLCCAICATPERPSSSSRIRCTRSSRYQTALRYSVTASSSAICPQSPLTRRK